MPGGRIIFCRIMSPPAARRYARVESKHLIWREKQLRVNLRIDEGPHHGQTAPESRSIDQHQPGTAAQARQARARAVGSSASRLRDRRRGWGRNADADL